VWDLALRHNLNPTKFKAYFSALVKVCDGHASTLAAWCRGALIYPLQMRVLGQRCQRGGTKKVDVLLEQGF